MKNEPRAKAEAPTCPDWLPGEAKTEWKRLVRELKRLNLVAKVDRDGLVDLCISIVRLREAEEDISKRGLVIDGKRNPSILTSKDYAVRLRSWAERFGLSPADRGRLDVRNSEPKPKDPAEKYFND
jgi:P27 family predicted phage terminase small subunit